MVASGCGRLQRVKRGYRVLHGDTRSDWGLQGVIGSYKGLQRVTRFYRGLQVVTEG